MHSSNKEININKDINIFLKVDKNKMKGVGSTSSTNVMETHARSFVRASMIGKKSATKTKILKKELMQESDSYTDEDLVNFMDSCGWYRD